MKDVLHTIFPYAAKFFYKKYRDEGGSQSRFAEELGISKTYLSSIINGSRTASVELQSRIANFFYGPYDKFLAVGRRLMEGRDPFENERALPDDSIESLIARLTHYVIDHKKLAGELDDLKVFYESIVENMQSGVFVTNAKDDIVYINKFTVEYAGVLKEMIIGTNMFKTGTEFRKGEFSEIQQKYFLAKKKSKLEFFENVPFTTPAGDLVFQTGWMVPRLKDGQFGGMIVTVSDTTRSQELSQLLTLSLENSENAIGIIKQTKPGGKVAAFFMNKKMRQLFDLDGLHPEKDSFDNIHIKTREHIQNRKEWEEFSLANLKTGRADAEFIIEHTNGKWYKWKSVALTSENSIYCGRMITVTATKKRNN